MRRWIALIALALALTFIPTFGVVMFGMDGEGYTVYDNNGGKTTFFSQRVYASHMSNKHWRSDATITVKDYTGPGLNGYVEIITRNWDTAMPTGGPSLTYQRMSEQSCGALDLTWRNETGAISVCQMSGSDENPAGDTELKTKDSRILAAFTRLVARDWTKANSPDAGYWWHPLGCHEMGHALGFNHRFTETDSCMGTQMQQPGSHDVANLKNQYSGSAGYAADPPLLPCCPRVTLVGG